MAKTIKNASSARLVSHDSLVKEYNLNKEVASYSLVSTILKVMTQLQMLYSFWLDKEIAPPTIFSLVLGFGANHSLSFIVQYWRHHIETREIRFPC